MAAADDLVGVWKAEGMYVPGGSVYEVLVFHGDGTGFLDFSEVGLYTCDVFRWSLIAPDQLQLQGRCVKRFNESWTAVTEQESLLDALVRFTIESRETDTERRATSLVLSSVPRSHSSDQPQPEPSSYRCHSDRLTGALRNYAVFRAPCFRVAEEDGHPRFRGQALSAYLAQQLEARCIPVGEMLRVFLGYRYHRDVQFRGQSLGLDVNWDPSLQEWWLNVAPPEEADNVGVQRLCALIDDILKGVDGLSDLTWLTEDKWVQRAEASPQGV